MYTQCIMWKNTGRREMQKNTNFLKKKYLVLSSFGMALIFVIKYMAAIFFMFCHSVDFTSKLVFFSYRLDSEDNKMPDQQIGCI